MGDRPGLCAVVCGYGREDVCQSAAVALEQVEEEVHGQVWEALEEHALS